MESELEEIEFLALSPNRVEVLRLLAEGPHTRSELAAATGASQATLGRILGDFEERSWVERSGSEHVATATGRLVSGGFEELLSILDTEKKLRPIVQYLPTAALDFDLRHLADATVTVPTRTRPNAPVQRLLDLEERAETVRAYSHAFNEQSLALVAERAAAGELSFRGVFSKSAIDALAADSELCRRLASLLDAENAEVRVHEGELPLAGTVADDVVHLLVRDDDGILQAALETDDEAVYEWATASFQRHWEAAEELRKEALEP